MKSPDVVNNDKQRREIICPINAFILPSREALRPEVNRLIYIRVIYISVRVEELKRHGLPPRVVRVLRDAGIRELYPPQEMAVLGGLLDLKDSFVVSVPTAAGKTLIAELLMVRSLLERGGRCLYIVPLRALAWEKYQDFKKYEALGLRCALTTGDYDSRDTWLTSYDIIVTTSEKADSLLRHGSEALRDVNVLVADEVHLINDPRRGPTLEVTIARLMHNAQDLLVLALSATIQNAGEIASWLGAKLVALDWRPVELREGVYCQGAIFFDDSSLQEVEKICANHVINLALEVVPQGGQSLVFVNTRKSAEKMALDISAKAREYLTDEEEDRLGDLAMEVLEVLPEPTDICRKLSRALGGGAAFHHAGLDAGQRRLIENGFRENLVKVVAATPTLAAGVNLPARRVVIRDHTRYDVNLGRVPIPVLEYKQQAGRAGRPGYDERGEAVMVARSYEERERLLDGYILAEPEAISSKLAVESALRTHVLASVAMGYADSFHALMEFFSRTFFAHQQDTLLLERHLLAILEYLEDEGLCRERDGVLSPTPFGRRVSELYLDPVSAVHLRNALYAAQGTDTVTFSYLHLLASIPEIGGLYLRRGEFDTYENLAHRYRDHLLVDPPDSLAEYWLYEEFVSQIKAAAFYFDWVDEKGENYIHKKYGLGPGDIRSKVELADWVLYAAQEICRLFRLGKAREVAEVRRRVRHGVKKELLELVSLRDVGRVRARALYSRGYKTLAALKTASVKELAEVRGIGLKTAESIKRQLEKST